MNKRKFVKIGGILIVLLALAALVGSSLTFAQDGPAPDDTATIPESGPNGRFGKDGPRGNRQHLIDREAARELLAAELGVTVEELDAAREAAREAVQADGGARPDRDEMQAVVAAELGVSVEELDAAKTAVREAMLAQLVEDGVITQEQLDEMLAMKELRGVAKDIFGREDAQAVIADTLGLTVEELSAAREVGTRLPELVEAQGGDMETVITAVTDARTAAINQAVADGTITQEQADLLLSQEGPKFGGPRGHGGPRGGGQHGGGQFGPSNGNSNFAPGNAPDFGA
ncbi:hypothetical protein MNBD_CHLOROFLEXI01-5184 [hydrothermal vent metagenome]|uniref:Uncharacterized protein n=1 Tax=hydrothermal vent metagenome TaxID=652676 RepID=A0A3B0UNE3_9ZZZZ